MGHLTSYVHVVVACRGLWGSGEGPRTLTFGESLLVGIFQHKLFVGCFSLGNFACNYNKLPTPNKQHIAMHRALTARLLNRALRIGEASASSSVPIFLCPAAGASTHWSRMPLLAPSSQTSIYSRRLNHTEATTSDHAEATTGDAPIQEILPSVEPSIEPSEESPSETLKRKLPTTCSGCGAFTQTSDPQQLGYFDAESKRVKKWLRPVAFTSQRSTTEEDMVVDQVLQTMNERELKELGLDPSLLISGAEREGNVAPSEYIHL